MKFRYKNLVRLKLHVSGPHGNFCRILKLTRLVCIHVHVHCSDDGVSKTIQFLFTVVMVGGH